MSTLQVTCILESNALVDPSTLTSDIGSGSLTKKIWLHHVDNLTLVKQKGNSSRIVDSNVFIVVVYAYIQCMYVYMYVCMHVCMYINKYVLYVSMHKFIYVCIYVCFLFVCMLIDI